MLGGVAGENAGDARDSQGSAFPVAVLMLLSGG